MPRVADDILPILTRFHREVVLPDIQRIVGESEQRLREDLKARVEALESKSAEIDADL